MTPANAPTRDELQSEIDRLKACAKRTAKHTPGPWEARKGAGWYVARPRYGEATLAVGMDGVTLVTSPSETPWNDDVESEANARLIAAAPELLEACEEFVRKCECGEALSSRSYAQMIAAIAKAKGEKGND